MIPFEVEEQPPPIPPRRTNPISLGLRWRRKRNALFRQIKNLTFDYPIRVKVYAFVALFLDYSLTSTGLNLIQRIHLEESQIADPWQNAFPPVLLAFLYIIPLIGVIRQVHFLLLIYVTLASLYLILAFIFTARSAFNFHYGHYFYRVHYCPTKFASSDSIICIVSLLKIIFFWPVFRCYMHARDCLEFSYYIKREDRNTYGVVDFDAIKEIKSKSQSTRMKSGSNIYTSEPRSQVAPNPSLNISDSGDPIYENTEIRFSHSSSLASTLNGIPIVDGEDGSYMDDSEMEIQFVEGVFMEDGEDGYSDKIEMENEIDDLEVIQNRLFKP